MANRLPHETRKMIVRLLCEGNSIRSTSRITGCEKKTVSNVILQFGQACQEFLNDQLQNLNVKHAEVDEIWSFVGKKQARLTLEERALRGDIGDVYLWTALDKDTKLIAAYAVGKRSADMARRLMVDLRKRLSIPNPHASDSHSFIVQGGYQPVIQISTDGFAAYPEAIDLAFGPYAQHGVLIKEYKNAKMAYDPSEMVGTKRIARKGKIDKFSIVTSHVERHNLTLRTFMKRFTRLALGFSKKLENHAAAVSLFIAYYNFVWRTRHSDTSGKSGTLRDTAAQMAGLTDHNWSFNEFYNTVINYG